MNDILLFAGDYLKGKSIYDPFRRILSFLFSASISSFLYEQLYGSYNWLDINDYKGILDFLIKGNFFIPLSIFIGFSFGSYLVSVTIFSVSNQYSTSKWTKKIINYELKKESIQSEINQVEKKSANLIPFSLSEESLVNLYNHIKTKLPKDISEKIEKELSKPKSDLESMFHLTFKGIFAITIYFISLEQFGWKLYCITLFSLVCSMYLTIIAYRFLDVFPTLLRKFNFEVDKYVSGLEPKKQENQT